MSGWTARDRGSGGGRAASLPFCANLTRWAARRDRGWTRSKGSGDIWCMTWHERTLTRVTFDPADDSSRLGHRMEER